jgi:hypothetical protein
MKSSRAWWMAGLLAAALCVVRAGLVADEGMWTFDNPPIAVLQERYGFAPTPAWLEHVRLASIRVNDGGSASFISADGLVLTNHHVASGQIENLSTPERNLIAEGFYARTPADELRAPDLELNVLESLEDVTARVARAIPPGARDDAALDARRAEIARIEKESLDATGLRSDVVTLYHGGEYWLYRYKVYTDVRLVFAPEQQIAYFGGDPDNFTFPRHDLDFAILRAYEDGKPAVTPHFLRVNPKGAADGELVFVSGHPASTDRLQTVAQLEFNRDHYYPWVLDTSRRRIRALRAYGARGPEQARQADGLILNLENSLKAISGELAGLNNPALMAKKRDEERAFRRLIDARPEWRRTYGSAWSRLERVQAEKAATIGHNLASFARLSTIAVQIVQYVAEVRRPDAERLPGFHDAQLEALRFQLLSPAPLYPELEMVLLADAWRQALELNGPDDPLVRAILMGRAPEDVARDVLSGTRLTDPAVRKALVEGGADAVAQSTDPLIDLARQMDPVLRERTRRAQQRIESVESAAAELIGRARFAVYGKTVSPDATFTLRLAFGAVSGYPMNGTQAPSRTTFHGLYDRAVAFGFKPPYDLPSRYVERKDRLDLTTPLNFVSTADIIGGNSGSPVINRQGELVGLIFDGNIESLVSGLVYDSERSRAVAVHAAAIIEVLRKVYDAGPLVDALEGR